MQNVIKIFLLVDVWLGYFQGRCSSEYSPWILKNFSKILGLSMLKIFRHLPRIYLWNNNPTCHGLFRMLIEQGKSTHYKRSVFLSVFYWASETEILCERRKIIWRNISCFESLCLWKWRGLQIAMWLFWLLKFEHVCCNKLTTVYKNRNFW